MAKANKAQPKSKAKTSRTPGFESDVYTALLGLTFLIMAATTVWACLQKINLYEKLF